MIKWLELQYGKMHISRVKVHDYLGMDLDYSIQGEVSVRIDKYVASTIKKLPEEKTSLVVRLAVYHILDVSATANRLEETDRRALQRSTVGLLFM